MGLPRRPEGQGFPEVETREDEEQNIKLTEILELLVAAGYFRARIKGLSPFDKVVGGMTWCITTCNFDVDVDLLFQENSTIGQKIALSEKIVSVLPRMKCPHQLEPHQIQGMDFIHIFPVVQWLVKRAIETKEEMGDYIRSYSISQFQKTHSLPEDDDFIKRKEKAIKTVIDISNVYRPCRKYRRQQRAEEVLDEDTRVHATLLEYGRRYGVSRESKIVKPEDKKMLPSAELSAAEKTEAHEDELQAAEEQRVQSLMIRMTAMATEESQLTASSVGQIVGLCSAEIKQIVSEYAEKERREAKADFSILQSLRALVAMNEHLKSQEQEFKAHCREEMTRLQQEIGNLKAEEAPAGVEKTLANGESHSDLTSLMTYNEDLDRRYNMEKEKLYKIRLLQARRNREIAILLRKIDEVPSRAELIQYQKRFLELYHQISAVHKETKQFFTLYNTLDDKKVYLEKEISLLNSIHENFSQAMTSPASRDQFLRQMEQIVEGIKQSRMKMEKKKQENKMRRDQLNDQYLELLEKQRLYFKTVKEFKEEALRDVLLTEVAQKTGWTKWLLSICTCCHICIY
ncbi:PREDICTED: coiled-coil domain-containing protein 93-like [Elephantulus edwardii]|uniref:coiled-coil domain-containing protein 93-like n=1 Tax=Elephantulus edwardii TaxID=28737 RepID=UPI0003F0AEDB|nr:PREDICTED: coiled-coil domain-containing protein 93-like [Elephantulus edwardii]